MEKYVRWFAGLGQFYQILTAGGLCLGLAAFATAVATTNPVFLLVALFWLAVAPAVVWLAARRDED